MSAGEPCAICHHIGHAASSCPYPIGPTPRPTTVLREAAQRVYDKFGKGSDWTEWTDLRDALKPEVDFSEKWTDYSFGHLAEARCEDGYCDVPEHWDWDVHVPRKVAHAPGHGWSDCHIVCCGLVSCPCAPRDESVNPDAATSSANPDNRQNLRRRAADAVDSRWHRVKRLLDKVDL